MLPVGTTLEQKRVPVATLTLIAANIVVFITEPAMASLLGENIRHLTFGPGSLGPIGLFTSLFLHADVFHIVFNMLYLWVFGPPVEDRLGKGRFVVYYLGAGVAANIINALVELIHDPASTAVGIGASGAISGIMALYLYRCFYSRLRMVVSPIFLPIDVNIPAAPLILFWFFKDVLGGIASFTTPTNIAHWAHVGGFLFGLAVGRAKRYGHEAAMEHYSGKVLASLRDGGGWKAFKDESALLKLLKFSPQDPEILLQLAQYYAAKGETAKADDFYQKVIRKYFVKAPLFGAFALLDRMEAAHEPMGLQYHLRAAEVLAENGYPEDGCRVLAPSMNGAITGILSEKAYVLFTKLCMELSRNGEAREAAAKFRELFPASIRTGEVEKTLSLKPGEIFPKRRTSMPEHAAKDVGEPEDHLTERQSKLMEVFHCSMRIITDPAFLFLWFFSLFVIFFFVPKFLEIQIVTFTGAFAVTAFYRINWSETWRRMTADEKKARREADAATLLNRAQLADRGEDYARASELYEKFLAMAPGNTQARFNLARIYHKKLRDRNNAVRQYRKLLELLPSDHPYRHEAEDAVRNGCR